jgi:hypothetical protein
MTLKKKALTFILLAALSSCPSSFIARKEWSGAGNIPATLPSHEDGCRACLYAAEDTDASRRYREIERLYRKWSEGLFGSGNFYRRQLYQYLFESMGKEVLTDYNYVLVSPEGVYDKKIFCRIVQARWLILEGEVDAGDLRNIIEPDPMILKKWWRSGHFFSLHGRIRKFRLDSDGTGNSVVLIMDRVALKRAPGAEKRKKD